MDDPTGMRASGRMRVAVWLGAAAIVAGPTLALGLISEPNELIFLAAIIAVIGVAYEVATRIPARLAYAAACALALATAISLVLMNGAVGIIGSEDNPQNRIFFAGPAVAAVGALVALFRPRGMVIAMVCAALAHVGVFIFAWVAGYGFTGPISTFFCAMWLIAAGLFRRAAAGRILRA